eukprot:XP_003730788.1 PREDICTED: DNA polymerase kappa [Strongylocentrotus purpuratus]
MLSALGIQTCTDLYQQRALSYLLFSQTSSSHFLHISLGLGSTHVERDGERKSMSTERTFKEISIPSELYSKCMELCEALAEDLKKEQIQGKTVTVKLKTVNFEVKSRASSLKVPVRSSQEIFAIARDLIRTEIRACHPQPLRLRLMGVRLSSFQDASKLSRSRQGTILDMFAKKQSNNPQPVTTPTPDCTEPTMGLLEESTSNNSFSGSVGTPGEVSDVSRIQVLVPNTKVSAPDTEILTSDTEDGVGVSFDNKERVEKKDVVSGSKKAPEARDSTQSAVGVGVSVNRVDRSVSSDTELSSEQTFESAITAANVRTSMTISNPHHSQSHLEPRLPFCEDDFVSGRENEHSSIADREEHTKQLYHPELLSKSEIFNQENNQRVDKLLKMNSHAKSDEYGSECTSSVEAEAQRMLTCPICRQERAYSTLEGLNQHIDACLNKSAIKEMLHRDKSRSFSSSNNQLTKSGPKKLHSRKRSNSGSGSSSSKKKRSKSTPCRTLYDFFQKKDNH